MPKLRCSGCKASLTPEDKSVQFITCGYCRSANKNPKFRETPVDHYQKMDQGPREHIQHPGNIGQSSDGEILRSLIPSLMPRRRFRRSRRRGGCGCGCGCGCLAIIIMILIGLGFINFILEVGFDELFYMIEQMIN